MVNPLAEPPATPDVAQILGEFSEFLNEAAGTHHAAVQGIGLLRKSLEPRLAGADPEKHFFIGHGAPAAPETLAYQRWKIGVYLEQIAEQGPMERTLGQQWAVLVHADWEDNFRPRLAGALGVDKNEVRSPHMADVRRMRNDIVHHWGVATTSNTGNCEALRWAEVGEPILITTERVAEFMGRLGLSFRP